MLDRKLEILLLVCLLMLADVPSVLCETFPPIVYVSGDESGDFNCNATNADIQVNAALQFVAGNSSYTTVYLKGPFTYLINDTLVLSSNITIAGDTDATIKLTSNAAWEKFKPLFKENSFGSQGITLQGFTIDGNREGNTKVLSGTDYYNLIHLTRCQNITVRDMYLTNNHGDGLKTDYCSNIKLYNNTIYELGHDGLYASYCSGVEAFNNNITCRTNSGLRLYNTNNASFHDNVITSNNAGGAGIEVQKYGSPAMDNIEVYNNTIYRTALSGIWIFGSNLYPLTSANVHIHHNRIYDTGTRSSTGVRGGILSDGFNALIENNVIDGSYGAGIVQNSLYSPGPANSGYVVTVRNNIITNTRTSTACGNGYGIYNVLAGTHSFILKNNCFYNNTGGDFIGVQASPSDIVADPQYADGSSHDYHLKSKAGRWDGVSWINDIINSPCIDAGDPLSDYTNEPEPKGSRINMGPDGGTYFASKAETDLSAPALPVAYFESNVTNGYAPLSVQFIDSSENTAAWNWDFGDSNYSTLQRPAHTYSAAGNYTVTLATSNANGTGLKSTVITVSEKPVLPVANFYTNTTEGYAPLLVQFTDFSQNAESWYWDFGDASSSTQQSPMHTYYSAGSYKVTLTASNNNGTDSKSALITVVQRPVLPVADFGTSTLSGYVPLDVQFNDLSQNAAWWYWDFGDGSSSTQPGPAHTYYSAGSYTVTLMAGNNNGTSSKSALITTFLRPVFPVADFGISATSGDAPLSVQFTDLSQYEESRSWDFTSDGTPDSSSLSPVYTYTVPGTYTASLLVRNANGTHSKTAAITVSNPRTPVAGFSSNVTSGTVPLDVIFTDMSMNTPTSWSWNFGDGTAISTQKNPVHTYSKAGSYTVILTAGNAAGSNTIRKTRYISAAPLRPPVAALSSNVTTGTVPLTVSFSDKSTGGSPASRTWSFGDGTSSTEQNPVHTYSKTGKYTVRLTVRNAAGSNTLTRTNYVTVNTLKPPIAAFSASPVSGAVPLSVTFTDRSTGSPASRSWNFGDNTLSAEQNPVHTFSKTGKYTVRLTVRNAAGSNTLTRTNYVTVNTLKTPVSAFSGSPTSGKVPLRVRFTDRSTESPTSFRWDFGDGTSSTTRNPEHIYTKKGKFAISLTARNSQGSNTRTMPGYITVS